MKSEKLLSGLRTLIDAQAREAELQAFLEENPLLISALFYRIPEGNVLVSQFPLGADYRADFAYVTHGWTEGTILHLVEIERPGLRLFTNADEFTAEANHAFQQLHDWASWCSVQRESLLHTLAPLLRERRFLFHFSVYCHLIAGRRSQTLTPRRQKRLTTRANLKRETFRLHTWDGFLERAESSISWHLWEPDENGRMRHVYSDDESDSLRCVVYKTQGLFEKDIPPRETPG
jgi:hypothetical protein